jgi:hypothetical protein
MCKVFLMLLILIFSNLNFLQSCSWACACGCGIFDVGTSSMFPSSQGGIAFFDYDFMDQTHNWSKASKSFDGNNPDKQIRTTFMNTGLRYMFDRRWGIQAELPYDHRNFKTTDDGTGNIVSFGHYAVGDMRIQGIYTGFSTDMSTGLTFGFKLPTGDWTYSHFDRDTEVGSGSTDALFGAYHRGNISSDNSLGYFIQDHWDQPFLTQGGYLPGTENNAAAGFYYNGFSVAGVKITPVAEILNSYRSRDRGWAANTPNSGYERILLSPGIELDYKKMMLYFDVGFPVYQYMNGNQLVASAIYKVSISYMF